MFDDEDEVRARQAGQPKLEDMSVEEMTEYISSLEAEIERVKAEIAQRNEHIQAAAQIFKS